MTEEKLADWIRDNQLGTDEYDMAYTDAIKATLPISGKSMEVERLSCNPLKHVYIKAKMENRFYVFEYSKLTTYLQEKISDAVESATSKE